MKSAFPVALLDRPAVEAASLVARAYLQKAAVAAKRLDARDDEESLHDFRVAIRRLRATLRGYPALRDVIANKGRRRLKQLARATNAARDAEVQIAWFRARSRHFTSAERTALAGLRGRMRQHHRSEMADVRARVARAFPRLERKLRRDLEAAAVQADAKRSFRDVLAPALRDHAAQAGDLLLRITSAADATELHQARIAVKRLRYLIEPVSSAISSGAALVEQLKQLQDLLGQIHDSHVLQERMKHRARLPTAARLQRAELTEFFVELQTKWLVAGRAELRRAVDLAAQEIHARARPVRAPRRRGVRS